MKFKRLIPVLLIKEGLLVRSQSFRCHQAIGDPIPTVKRLSDWNVDEVVLLNIGSGVQVDSRRDDKWHNLGEGAFSDLVNQTSESCFCPLSVGGGIRTLAQFAELFASGADKCIVNTACFTDPSLIKEAVKRYGSQAVVASIDVLSSKDGSTNIAINNGNKVLDLSLSNAISHCRDLGVGELLLGSITNDGSGHGYDENILRAINGISDISIILNSGATTTEHFAKGLREPATSACAASNVFYFTELSYPLAKKSIAEKHNISLRQFDPSRLLVDREPAYPDQQRKNLLLKADSDSFFDPEK